jgi:hypothetical protein
MTLFPSRRDFLKQSAIAAAAAAWARPGFADGAAIVADTKFGKVRGVDVNGIKTFKGIPYGASTAGNNRFMPPADPTRWPSARARRKPSPALAATRRISRWPAPAFRVKAKTASSSMSGHPRLPTVASGR